MYGIFIKSTRTRTHTLLYLQAKEILAQDKAFDKRYKELTDTLKESAIKMNSVYAIFKKSAQDIYKG